MALVPIAGRYQALGMTAILLVSGIALAQAHCHEMKEFLVLQPFRRGPRIIGGEKLPRDGPIILAANHSGTAFPYDAIVLDFALWKRDDLVDDAKFRSVYEPELSLVWWMRPFGIDNLWRRGGGVDMTFDNFERLLQRGDRVIYYPEGVPGIGPANLSTGVG